MKALPIIDINELSTSNEVVKVANRDKDEIINATSYDLAQLMVKAILEGQVDPLEFLVKKKLISDALDMACKVPEVKALMLEEQAKHGKDCKVLGAKISVTSRPSYKYEHDAKWLAIAAEMKPLSDKLKEQEKKIQAACKNNCSLIDENSGEIIASIVPHPATESLSVSFAKK